MIGTPGGEYHSIRDDKLHMQRPSPANCDDPGEPVHFQRECASPLPSLKNLSPKRRCITKEPWVELHARKKQTILPRCHFLLNHYLIHKYPEVAFYRWIPCRQRSNSANTEPNVAGILQAIGKPEISNHFFFLLIAGHPLCP